MLLSTRSVERRPGCLEAFQRPPALYSPNTGGRSWRYLLSHQHLQLVHETSRTPRLGGGSAQGIHASSAPRAQLEPPSPGESCASQQVAVQQAPPVRRSTEPPAWPSELADGSELALVQAGSPLLSLASGVLPSFSPGRQSPACSRPASPRDCLPASSAHCDELSIGASGIGSPGGPEKSGSAHPPGCHQQPISGASAPAAALAAQVVFQPEVAIDVTPKLDRRAQDRSALQTPAVLRAAVASLAVERSEASPVGRDVPAPACPQGPLTAMVSKALSRLSEMEVRLFSSFRP